jgi:Bacterial Ig domain/Calx-beta domain
MKTIRWLGCAVLLLVAFGLVPNLKADNPPWPPLVLVIAADPDAAEEGSDPAQFLVVRVGFANGPLTVQYALGGDAVNGDDYETLSGEVTIPDGAYFAPVTITPHDDFLIEGEESVVIALQQPPIYPPPYIVTWPSVAVASIADNDFEPTNQPPHVSIVSPPDGAEFEAFDDILIVAKAVDRDGRVRTVEFFADGVSLGTVTNRPLIATADLISVTEDPTFDLDPDAFPSPDVTPLPGPIPVPIPGNLFRLIWTDAPPGTHVLTAVATDNDGDSTESAPVTIEVLPPPPRPVVNILAPDPVASEPDPTSDHLDTATFTIYRRGPTNDPLRVFYRIGGTAFNGADYREIAHSVEIPAGLRRAHVIIAPIDDLLVEGPESVILKLIEPPCADEVPAPLDCYDVGRADTARAVIRDNDTPPNRPPLVRLVKPEDGDVFLAPADIRLVALARDFDGYVTTVEFFEGTNSLGIVTNYPTTNSVYLPPFTLVWSNVPPGRYVLSAVATDNEGASTPSLPVEIKVVPRVLPPEVNITATDPEGAETGPLMPPNIATFQVTRTGSTTHALVVYYRIGGTASNGVDYTAILNRVEIPVGASSANIFIRPIDDNLVEGIETVALKLTQPPVLVPVVPAPIWWYRIGSNYAARVAIKDNDFLPTNQPPRVKIISPEDGDVFEAPLDLKLAAVAQDPDGWVRTVEFFDGNVSLGVVSNNLGAIDINAVLAEQVFRLLWQNVPPGHHVLTALATDNRGASTRSDPVEIKVLPPPRPPVITIYATDPYASEGPWLDSIVVEPVTPHPIPPTAIAPSPDTATFTVVRCGDVSEELTVYYKLDGTAINGRDYRELPGKVTFAVGQQRAKIVVDPIDDNLREGRETVVAALVPVYCPAIFPPPPGCYTVGDPCRAVAYIFDNDFNLSPRAEIVQPADGDLFRENSDIEIDVAARDPDGWVTKVEFFANHIKIGEQEILFIVPPPPGQLQRFSMVWSNVPAGDYVLQARATDNDGAISITDPVRIKVVPVPPLPVVIIEAIDPLASEPYPLLPAIDSATFRVSRHGDLSGPLTVHYRTGGSASNGVDYIALSGTVILPSNAPSALIEVVPKHDTLVEGTESVILTLIQPPCVASNAVTPDCYLVGYPGRDIAYIRDNDQPNRPPTVAIVSPANGAVFTAPVDLRLVAAAGDSDGWVTTVEFFDGTNSLGIVRNPIAILDPAPVRLADLNTDVLIDHPIGQPFVLIWFNAPPGKHVLTAVATDNAGDSTRSRPIEIAVRAPTDLPVVRIMAVDPIAREGTSNTAAFRIRRTGPTNSALTVFYQIRGTASNGVDYAAIPNNSLTIPAGRRSARIVITPIDDNLPERIETVFLRLTLPPVGPPTYEIGRPTRAGAVILDNDHPLMSPELIGDGLHLRLAAFDGMPFRLESSTDLVNWGEEACDICAEDGVSVVDETGENVQRFFRIVPEYGTIEQDD